MLQFLEVECISLHRIRKAAVLAHVDFFDVSFKMKQLINNMLNIGGFCNVKITF